jgi:molecular chaperone DnaK (HSP70)
VTIVGSSGLAASRRGARALGLLAALAIACAGHGTGTSITVSATPLGDKGRLVHSLGVAAAGGSVAAVLPLGCALPCEGTFSVRTTRRDQKRITLSFYTMAERATAIGGVQIVGLPPGPAGERGADVKIRASKEKVFVNAALKESGAELEVRTLLAVGP